VPLGIRSIAVTGSKPQSSVIAPKCARFWRKAVRIEHTSNSRSRSTVLKTARDTSPNSLPLFTLAHSDALVWREEVLGPAGGLNLGLSASGGCSRGLGLDPSDGRAPGGRAHLPNSRYNTSRRRVWARPNRLRRTAGESNIQRASDTCGLRDTSSRSPTHNLDPDSLERRRAAVGAAVDQSIFQMICQRRPKILPPLRTLRALSS